MTAAIRRHYDFLRVRIEGQLVTESMLHCGDGESLPAEKLPFAKASGHISTVCKSGRTRPFIPASTLRGSLRDRCPESDFLFGTAGQTDRGHAGAVRVYDAFWHSDEPDGGDLYWNPDTRTTLRDGVSIDSVTGTAAERKLFTFEVVPAGTRFWSTLEADRISEQDLQRLLELVAGWDATLETAIGNGRGKGWGRVRWSSEHQKIALTTDDDIAAWVRTDLTAPYPVRNFERVAVDSTPVTRLRSINFTLRPRSPLLVNDPARLRAKASSEEHPPAFEFMRAKNGHAIVPGSTLRGATRAHAHRILATIAHRYFHTAPESAAERVKPLVERLFGKERQRGLLWFRDAIAEGTIIHSQPFNAVDRFTGGVAKTALYTAHAADCELLTGSCTFDAARIPSGDWWKGLLLLLARDYLDGDLILGWGKSRGFGACSLSIETPDGKTLTDGASLLDYFHASNENDATRRWVEQLHRAIKQCCSD